MITGTAVRLVLPFLFLSSTACSLATVLNKNLEAINKSTAVISANSDVIKESTRVTKKASRVFRS